MSAARASNNDDRLAIHKPLGAALVTERPWLTDPKYGGMSAASAERSYLAAMKYRAEAGAVRADYLPEHDGNEPPLPKSLAEYGLPADSVTEQIIEYATALPTQGQPKFTRFPEILLSTTSRYLVKGIIPNVGLVVVWGAPKCGKSFFIFDMVAHIAAGWEYRGSRVKQSTVVYFALEGQEGFVARVEAFRAAHRISDIPFYLSAARMSRAAFNCVVIVIHHCGVEGSRPRGHTSLTGAADAQIAVKRDAADNVVATVEFMKDGPQGAEIISSLEQVTVGTDDDGDAITSCVIRPAEASSVRAKAKVTGQAALALRVLHDTIIEAGEVPPVNSHIPPNTRTIAEKTCRANCYAGMTTDDTTQTARQKAFVRASNKLQEQKLIGVWGDHVWLT